MAAGASMAGGDFEGSGWSIGIAPGDLRGAKPRNQPISRAGPAGRPYLLELLLALNAAICCVM